MKAVTVKKIKDELKHKTINELLELCLHLSKFKKENKELLTYLLFEAENEERFIETIKEEMDELFEEINTKSYYYIRKSVRKILSLTKKHIRYSKKKETEVQLLLHFCEKLKNLKPSISRSVQLKNVFDRQLIMVEKALKTLHEDLQFDYQFELDNLKSS